MKKTITKVKSWIMCKAMFSVILALFLLSSAKYAMSQEAYVVLDQGVLTFYYNDSKPQGAFSMNKGNNFPEWHEFAGSVTKVVFDDSFANYAPVSCAYWFWDCNKLTKFEGMKNLNTSQATTLKAMFQDCHILESVDLSNFNTSKVTDMSCMFRRCYNMPSIDFSSFDTKNTVDFRSMFELTTGLQSLDLSMFKPNPKSEIYIRCMFVDCSGVKTIDLSGFNTKKVTNMEYVFARCNNLRTIYVSKKWSNASIVASGCMFCDCNELYGGNGTHYTFAHHDSSYACIDNPKQPGYFTQKGKPAFNPNKNR